MHEFVRTDESLDILCNDKLRLLQKKKGYRFSMDPFLLAGFIRLKKHERVLDVGTGCGIIPIYMTKKGSRNRFVGIEIQEELYDLAVRNKELNDCPNVELLHGDVRKESRKLGTFQAIISNPPYIKEKTGRTCPGYSRHVARCESMLQLTELISSASSLLSTHGRLYLIYPAKRLAELINNARSCNLEPKRVRLVHSRPSEPATLCLTECMKGGGTGLLVEPPLYIYQKDDYTEEIKAYYV
jgi:tRNA1Val (adenine37-N6)-methyltransferase